MRGLAQSASPRMLTLKEAAQELGICRRSVERHIERGELRVHRFGRAVRIDKSDLETFVRSKRDLS
jgi:excisionase family DNA binding protein